MYLQYLEKCLVTLYSQGHICQPVIRTSLCSQIHLERFPSNKTFQISITFRLSWASLKSIFVSYQYLFYFQKLKIIFKMNLSKYLLLFASFLSLYPSFQSSKFKLFQLIANRFQGTLEYSQRTYGTLCHTIWWRDEYWNTALSIFHYYLYYYFLLSGFNCYISKQIY